MASKIRVVGISFEHMHMGDNLRMAAEHPDCEVVGICDAKRERMLAAQADLRLTDDRLFEDWKTCIETCSPDIVVLCPATGDHGIWVQRLSPYKVPILLEKPMAASLADADTMIAACQEHGTPLAINWPLVWVPSHRTAKRLIDEGRIGALREVHYYDGNRGPLWHTAGKQKITAEQVQKEKPESWFYKQEAGGGSLLDYLGYGVTLGTWFMGGESPIEVTAVWDEPDGLDVDEHSITIARYQHGISKFETRWGTFTDPWTHQPQPKCGFVLVGTEGTISSYDYESTIRVQDRSSPAGEDYPVDELDSPQQNPIQYFVDCLQHEKPVDGPLSPQLSRIGQQIVDTAFQSAKQKRTLPLLQ
ncbi:MAG: Gfo/Idh/MocA family oxidoreductase [Planctomycetota bacterium]|nr:Gfo/Idh/MocA family oxidoreductase [Planctomycetota bacterium]